MMRRAVCLSAFLAVLALCVPAMAVAQQAPTPEERMAQLVNEARIAHGLNPVGISAELTAAAAAHTRDMATYGYMEHAGRDGSSPQSRAIRHGYRVPPASPWIVVEVISARPTAEAAVNWLLTDRLHRGVMLRPSWREMGLSYVKGGPFGQFWTIDFGCRPNVLPVLADATPSGAVKLYLTNEDCAPAGGNAEQIGKATQMMVSDRGDFGGGVWEPFVATKTVAQTGRDVFVRLKDARGREVTNSTSTSLTSMTTSSATPIPAPSPSTVASPPTSPPASPSSSPSLAPPVLLPSPSSGPSVTTPTASPVASPAPSADAAAGETSDPGAPTSPDAEVIPQPVIYVRRPKILEPTAPDGRR